jgi:nitrogen-specific signal transduction histidine kinase
MAMGTDEADRLRALADRVDRLSPSRHDPERFFEERSEIARDLEDMASRADATARLP